MQSIAEKHEKVNAENDEDHIRDLKITADHKEKNEKQGSPETNRDQVPGPNTPAGSEKNE